MDPCLFINHQKRIFCLVYVDDIVWVAPSCAHIDKVLASLKDDFKLTIEGDIQTFLGIQFTRLQNGTIHLTQCGLIDHILKATGMQDSNPDQTPASTKPLGLHKNGAPLIENAQTHFQDSLFGCFEYIPYTALAIVCTIKVRIDCKKNKVSNPFTRKNILLLDYKSKQ